MPDVPPVGKLPGKTEFSGRRRSATRESGFHVHAGTTGGELRVAKASTIRLAAGEAVTVGFSIPAGKKGHFVGFGGWYSAPSSVRCELKIDKTGAQQVLSPPSAPAWGKFGSMWVSDGTAVEAALTITASRSCQVALWGVGCGAIEHKHLRQARKELLGNMYMFSPEAHFYTGKGSVGVSCGRRSESLAENGPLTISLKSCNRCGRYLPINIPDERKPLSFSNHCVAAHRRPCSHATFGRLRDVDTGEVVALEYGFQLECRFCKKFEVNAAHNPQRSTAQMKEDAQRRRAFEELTTELYGQSALLRYRHLTGHELADDVFKRFNGTCFKCGKRLPTARKMQLDHTRPLALLWPLDGTATSLCKDCNSEKRDRAPAEFYDQAELTLLAELTGLPLAELKDPSPNTDAVDRLRQRRDWFFDIFLRRPELLKVRDGKTAAELLVKALQKVIDKCLRKHQFDLEREFEKRRLA